MCGILGVLPAVNENKFRTALGSLNHRGPDGYGVWTSDDSRICLGHRRLSILDLSIEGKQPMHYLQYSITFNGEIYNFLEIRKELLNKGYSFKSDTDTEVILAAFDCWGEGCLTKFNGMWAFAIWDHKKQELFISRDRFGKKPFFYYIDTQQFIFASEMKAIAPLMPKIQVSNSFRACAERMFDYEQTENCLIEDIKRFPSASYAYYRKGDSKITPISFYNTMSTLHDVPSKYEDQVSVFRELFLDACRQRMRSDVAIGTALSGGLDSSATICTMAHIGKTAPGERVSTDWQHAFVACFQGSFMDERVYAEKVVKHLGIAATYIEIDPVKGIEDLMEDLYLFEELYITSPVPMVQTYKAVKQHGVSVTIDGHGADELMIGYGKHLFDAFLDCGINFREAKDILDTYNATRVTKSRQFEDEDAGWKDFYEYMNRVLKGRKNMLRHFIRSLTGSNNENISKGKMGHFNNTLYNLFHHSILPTLLRNYDRYAMSHGVEIRMPFMDHRLVSFAFSLPWQSKLGHGYTKRIIRDALRPFMPKSIVSRTSKIGFNTPIVDWLKGPWRSFFMDHINSVSFKQCALINPIEVRNKVSAVINDPTASFSDGEQAWIGMMPYLWEQGFYKKVRQAN